MSAETAKECSLFRENLHQVLEQKHDWETHEIMGDSCTLCEQFSVSVEIVENAQYERTLSIPDPLWSRNGDKKPSRCSSCTPKMAWIAASMAGSTPV